MLSIPVITLCPAVWQVLTVCQLSTL